MTTFILLKVRSFPFRINDYCNFDNFLRFDHNPFLFSVVPNDISSQLVEICMQVETADYQTFVPFNSAIVNTRPDPIHIVLSLDPQNDLKRQFRKDAFITRYI